MFGFNEEASDAEIAQGQGYNKGYADCLEALKETLMIYREDSESICSDIARSMGVEWNDRT